MKNLLKTAGTSVGRKFAGTSLACMLFIAAASAQVNSPVGQWDVVTSGAGQSGIMLLTFDPPADPSQPATLFGCGIMAPTSKKLGSANPRGGGSDRGGGSSTNSVSKTNVFVYGFTPVTGKWQQDPKGKVIGYYWYVIYDPSTGEPWITNSVSFTGKANTKRLTLLASTSLGKMNMKGVPLVPATTSTGGSFDASQWYGTKKKEKVLYQEFFQLGDIPADSGLDEFTGNVFLMSGTGPGYTYTAPEGIPGISIISRQKKIAFDVPETMGTNVVNRASVGNLKMGKKGTSAKTKGMIDPGESFTFDVFKY